MNGKNLVIVGLSVAVVTLLAMFFVGVVAVVAFAIDYSIIHG